MALPTRRPVLVRGRGERMTLVHRRVVHEHVDAAQRLVRRVGDPRGAPGFRQVAAQQRVTRAVEGVEGAARVVLTGAVVNGDTVAVGGEGAGDGAAEPS